MFQNLPHTSFDLQSNYVSENLFAYYILINQIILFPLISEILKKLYSFLNGFQLVVNSSDIFPKFLWPLAVLSNI